MTGTLAAHRHHPALGDLLVRGTCPQRRSEVGLAACEQAVAHMAVGSQPDPVAITPERTRDRGADHDRSRTALDPDDLGGRAPPPLHARGQRERLTPPRLDTLARALFIAGLSRLYNRDRSG